MRWIGYLTVAWIALNVWADGLPGLGYVILLVRMDEE
jgi:hypothetical protein